MPPALQRTLQALSFEPALARLLAGTSARQREDLARWLVEADPYGERRAIEEALRRAGAERPDALAHVKHQLWCAAREAQWRNGLADELAVWLDGEDALAETAGHPTLLITPMTLATADALRAIATIRQGRRCIVFGEDAPGAPDDPEMEILTGAHPNPARRILDVVRGGGVLCTYADFVYEGRTASTMPLFGARRPVSSGFVSLAARDGTMLLPLRCAREAEAIALHVEEPVLVRSGGDRRADQAAVAELIGELLEALIAQAPAQWRLLPTLTFEAPQMAAASA